MNTPEDGNVEYPDDEVYDPYAEGLCSPPDGYYSDPPVIQTGPGCSAGALNLPNQPDGSSGPKPAKVSRFDPGRTYSFPREFAKEYGVDEAILVQHLVYLSEKSNRRHEGKVFVRKSAGELAELYPWKERRAWQDTLRRLVVKNVLTESDQFRRTGLDQSLSYAVSPKFISAAYKEERIRFNAGEAREHSVCAAVLLTNLRFFLKWNYRERGECGSHAMQPTALAKSLPFSLSSIKRALDVLVEKDLARREWDKELLAHRYWIPGFQPVSSKPQGQTDSADAQFIYPPAGISFAQLVESNARSLAGLSHIEAEILAIELAAFIEPRLLSLSCEEILAIRRSIDDVRVNAAHHILKLPQDHWKLPSIEIAVFALRESTFGPVGHVMLLRHGYRLAVKIGAKLEQWRLENARRSQEQWQLEIRNALEPLRSQLADFSLHPERKMHILRKALNVRAHFGRYQTEDETDVPAEGAYPVSWSGADLRALVTFFEANPAWPPGALFSAIEQCVKLNNFSDSDDYDPLFHARKGTSIKFLLVNLDKIIPELGLGRDLPILVPLEYLTLYPKRDSSQDSDQ